MQLADIGAFKSTTRITAILWNNAAQLRWWVGPHCGVIATDYLQPPRLPREAENSVRGAGSILDVP